MLSILQYLRDYVIEKFSVYDMQFDLFPNKRLVRHFKECYSMSLFEYCLDKQSIVFNPLAPPCTSYNLENLYIDTILKGVLNI